MLRIVEGLKVEPRIDGKDVLLLVGASVLTMMAAVMVRLAFEAGKLEGSLIVVAPREQSSTVKEL